VINSNLCLISYRLAAIHRCSASKIALAGIDRDGGTAVHRLIIEARDHGSDGVPATATVTVEITDINDTPPEVKTVESLTSTDDDARTYAADASAADAVVPEDAAVGTFVAHLSVEDVDEGEGGLFDCHLQVTHVTRTG